MLRYGWSEGEPLEDRVIRYERSNYGFASKASISPSQSDEL